MFERGSARDPSAQSSLCWVERRFCVKSRRARRALCCDFATSLCCNDSSCCSIQNRTGLAVVERAKCAAVVLHRRLVLDAVLGDLLHCL